MDISLPYSATQARAHQMANPAEMPSIPSKTHFSKTPLLFLPTYSRIFFYKANSIMCIVLSILIAINVQTKSDINLGGQGMVITNQRVAIQPCFQQAKHMQFCKTGQ